MAEPVWKPSSSAEVEHLKEAGWNIEIMRLEDGRILVRRLEPPSKAKIEIEKPIVPPKLPEMWSPTTKEELEKIRLTGIEIETRTFAGRTMYRAKKITPCDGLLDEIEGLVIERANLNLDLDLVFRFPVRMPKGPPIPERREEYARQQEEVTEKFVNDLENKIKLKESQIKEMIVQYAECVKTQPR